jgi:hypothetical protein
MPKISPSRLNVCAFFASCLLLFIDMQLVSRPTVSAQTQGCPNINNLNGAFWEPFQPVTVVFQDDSNRSDDEIAVMQRALENWNDANGYDGNFSGVTFVGFARGPRPDKNTATHTCVVRRSDGHGDPSAGTIANVNSGGYTGLAIIEWDTNVNFFPSWDPAGLGITKTTAHEIGHTFRLSDCYSCSNTIMCSACSCTATTSAIARR